MSPKEFCCLKTIFETTIWQVTVFVKAVDKDSIPVQLNLGDKVVQAKKEIQDWNENSTETKTKHMKTV